VAVVSSLASRDSSGWVCRPGGAELRAEPPRPLRNHFRRAAKHSRNRGGLASIALDATTRSIMLAPNSIGRHRENCSRLQSEKVIVSLQSTANRRGPCCRRGVADWRYSLSHGTSVYDVSEKRLLEGAKSKIVSTLRHF
jgi:hypothetical protein